MKSLELFIKDISWKFQVKTDKDYEQLHGSNCNATTSSTGGYVHFKESKFSMKLVLHEMFHVYSKSCCTESMNDLDAYNMEELGAEIIEHHCEQLLENSKFVYNKLKPKQKKSRRTSK